MDEKQLDHMLDANIFNPELAQIDNKTIEDVFNDVLDPPNINSPSAGMIKDCKTCAVLDLFALFWSM